MTPSTLAALKAGKKPPKAQSTGKSKTKKGEKDKKSTTTWVSRRRRLLLEPRLRISPVAWAKLLYLRDYGETEVGGFGISPEDDLLFVEDFRLVEQVCSATSVEFDDTSVADFFDEQVDAGRKPAQFARIWVHTHPGDSAWPSTTDEDTFDDAFGNTDWSVMFIVAKGGETYARLRYTNGPGAEILIPVNVDYKHFFAGCDPDSWEEEYLKNVQVYSYSYAWGGGSRTWYGDEFSWYDREIAAQEAEDERRLGVGTYKDVPEGTLLNDPYEMPYAWRDSWEDYASMDAEDREELEDHLDDLEELEELKSLEDLEDTEEKGES